MYCQRLSAAQGIFRRRFCLERHRSAPNRLGGAEPETAIQSWRACGLKNHFFFGFFPPDFLLPASLDAADFLEAAPLDFLAEDLPPFFAFGAAGYPPPDGAPPPEALETLVVPVTSGEILKSEKYSWPGAKLKSLLEFSLYSERV